MTFASPAGLWLLLLALPIVLLHILKPRRDSVEVPSVFLWRSVEVAVSGARPWQRLRPSLLLFAQLLAVVGLALAVARPVRLTESPVADHTVFIVDASGSMAAHDGDPNRLGDAIDTAKELRREIPDGGVASVVVADTRPRVVLSTSSDRSSFDDAVESIETTDGAADFAGAFILAEGLETGEGDIAFVLLSDGGLTDDEQRLLPPGTTYERVGDDATNRAITRLSVEPRGAGLFAVVALRNTGSDSARQTLRLDVDGRTEIDQRVELAAGESTELTFDLPAGERVEAFLEGEDLLDADDHYYAAAPPRRALQVAVAGPPDAALEALLEALKAVERVDYTWTEQPDVATVNAADVAIYNQVDVPLDATAPFWALRPPGGLPDVSVTGEAEAPVPTLVRSDDTLLAELDLSEVLFGTTQKLDAPLAETLVGAEGTPLVLRGHLGEVPYLYSAFALPDTTLPVAGDVFPILGDRLLAELAGAALPPGALSVGETLPVDAARPTTVSGPGDITYDVAAGQPPPHADRVGFWTVQPEGQPAGTLAVNPASRESDVRPVDSILAPERNLRPGEELPRGQSSLLHWVVPPLLAVLVLEWLLARRRRGVSTRQFRFATALRVFVALALVGALLDLTFVRRADEVATVFVVDASDSLGAAGQEEALQWVRDALEEMPGDARAAVELFGGDPRLELTMQSDPVLGPATVVVDTQRTNLAGALRLAGSVLPTDARRRIVLVSDGRPTEGDVMEEADRLAETGIPVDFHVVDRGGGPDAAVTDVEVPNRARVGEQVPITVTVHADEAGPALVALLQDGVVIEERPVTLAAGDNVIGDNVPSGDGASDPPFLVTAAQVGVARFQARVTTATDTVRENDVGYGAVQVEGPPTVLVLEGRSGAAAGVAGALQAGGLAVDVRDPGALPAYDELSSFASIVLVDVPAEAFSPEQVSTLTAAVQDLGRGLVTVGGTQSYGLGGYLDTPLEELLPVVSDILDPKRRQTVSEVLAIDTSGSMGACHCSENESAPAPGNRGSGGIRKTDIARAGAARAIEALSSSDSVGILAVDTEDEWVMDLQQLPSQEVVDSGLAKITPSGETTNLSTALTTAAESLRSSHTALKHIILFTDGFVNESGIYEDMEAQAAALYAEGITVSVLATGEGAAAELEAIATAGGGRFYPGRDLQEIPQLLQQEATIASRDFVNEGEFLPTITSSSDWLQGLTSPPLLGYIATTAKPQALTDLRIGPDEDPLLASWNAGLGRVTSWMSDGGDRWAQTWLGWGGYVDFWTNLVGETFPRTREDLTVTSRVVDGTLEVRVEGTADFEEGSSARARVVGPDLQAVDVPLERVGSNVFAGSQTVTAAGSYSVAAQVVPPGADAGGGSVGGDALASLSFSPEYEPGEADPSLLRRIAEETGGRSDIAPSDAFDPENLPAGRSHVPLARWLLVIAALLWPVAVALSRLALRGSVVGQVQHVGATTLWWLRNRLPARDPDTAPRPKPPPKPVAPRDPEKEAAAAPTATIGTLLASQRRRKGLDPDDDADDT